MGYVTDFMGVQARLLKEYVAILLSVQFEIASNAEKCNQYPKLQRLLTSNI